MLGKLAYRNTKRNIKDYLIYLITVTASFSLIFAFNLVANSDEIVSYVPVWMHLRIHCSL